MTLASNQSQYIGFAQLWARQTQKDVSMGHCRRNRSPLAQQFDLSTDQILMVATATAWP